MNTNLKLTLRWPAIAAMIVCWLTPFATLTAQTSGTGTIRGRVYNPVSKEYVRNADVRLEGTNQVTSTENDGSFQFVNVPAGPASVTVNYTGYKRVSEAFTVTPGQIATREINLTSTQAGAADASGN